MRKILKIILLITLISCHAEFVEQDVSDFIKNKKAAFIVDNSSGYSIYGGYGSACAHPGGHVIFDEDAQTRNIYAVSDGIISRIDDCSSAGVNDKYDIQLNIGMFGSTPVYFDYSIEPFGGAPCGSNSDVFKSNILVKEGDRVTKGQKIATITPGDGSDGNAHIHFQLSADGATICPDIFKESFFTSGNFGVVQDGDCEEPATSLCAELTSSERPDNLY